MPFEQNNTFWKLANSPRTQPRTLDWVFDGNCIRCTSHATDERGYVLLRRGGKKQSLPRLLLSRRLGRAPEVARHTCDNRWCINPDHILNGTHADNARDRESRGRGVRNPTFGSAHWNAKLSEEQVLEIRNSNLTQCKLAALHGVTQPLISKIKSGKQRKRG